MTTVAISPSGRSRRVTTTLTCGNCGRTFTAFRRDASYCSGACKDAAYRRRRQDLHQAAETARTSGSLKDAILATIVTAPGAVEISDLAKATGSDTHSVVHLVWSLQKQGLVSFVERANGGASRWPSQIIETVKGHTVATAGTTRTQLETEPEHSEPVTMLVDTTSEWPELERIYRRGTALQAAADVLAGVGGLEDLYQLVTGAQAELTPVEAEYLRFYQTVQPGRSLV